MQIQQYLKMENTTNKKRQTFRVNIRRKQIDSYMKSRRVQMLRNVERTELSSEQEEIYHNVVNYTTLANLSQLDTQELENHLQMLIEVLHSDCLHKFYQLVEGTLSTLIQFYSQLEKHWFDSVNLNLNRGELMMQIDAVQMVVINKIFSYMPASMFVRFIGVTYFYVVPSNQALMRKVVSLLRDLLKFTTKSPAEMQYNLMACNIPPQELISLGTVINSIMTTLMNITFSEDPQILKIVYEQCIIQDISAYVEERGFSQLVKESIAGVYSNMIQYLCSLIADPVAQSMEDSEQSQRSQDYYLFLPIFQELIKTENNIYIKEKMVVASIELIKANRIHNLSCKDYIFDLIQQLMRSILAQKQYLEWTEDLFVLYVEESEKEGFIGWILQFLKIILNEYTYLYTIGKEKQKEHCNMMEQSGRTSPERSLKNISRLIGTCDILISKTEDQKKAVVDEIIDFWCREQLVELQLDFINFIASCIEKYPVLRSHLLQSSRCNEVVVSLINRSYTHLPEIEAGMKLTTMLLTHLNNICNEDKLEFISQFNTSLSELKIRLQDYLNTINTGNIFLLQLVEANLQELTFMLENCDTI